MVPLEGGLRAGLPLTASPARSRWCQIGQAHRFDAVDRGNVAMERSRPPCVLCGRLTGDCEPDSRWCREFGSRPGHRLRAVSTARLFDT